MLRLTSPLSLLAVLLALGCGGALAPSGSAPTEEAPPFRFVRQVCGGSTENAGTEWCAGTETLTLAPTIRVAGADALVSGASGTIDVVLGNPNAAHVNYPCVGFTADTDAVSFGPDQNPLPLVYAILPNTTETYSMPFQLSSTVARGTVIRFATWADVLHSGCSNGAVRYFSAMIQ